MKDAGQQTPAPWWGRAPAPLLPLQHHAFSTITFFVGAGDRLLGNVFPSLAPTRHIGGVAAHSAKWFIAFEFGIKEGFRYNGLVHDGMADRPMTCAGCGLEQAPGFAFCVRCGRPQPTPCHACGFACEPDFAFCPRCGAARARRAIGEPANNAAPAIDTALPGPIVAAKPRDDHEADRRQVTVLFADVSGFTTLAERLDPEEVRAFQNALFEPLAQVVAHYDGFVEKFVGDAVLAVFGAPVAHEDDPERALNAALDMVGCVNRLNELWAGRLGQPIGLHIGVHTGPVVAGRLGSAAGAAYAVTGDTVNTTARLLAAASGAILVSEAAYALTLHRFAFEPRAS